ncbi:hypothetical protein ADK86_26105 [Streptomyces sp. NRRL F-5755]|nr:hypothetical protein ADK86_26105 [Streptomyces sp. NRRL F-5755]
MDNLTPADGTRLPVVHYAYDAGTSCSLLHEHGFADAEVLPVEGPEGSSYRTLVIRACRIGD